MQSKNWYIHLLGETLGPFPETKVTNMLEQGRVSFADFAWTDGFSSWMRFYNLPTFAALMPEYPKSPIPKTQGHPPFGTSARKEHKSETKHSTNPHKTAGDISVNALIRFGDGCTERVARLSEKSIFVRPTHPIASGGKELSFTLECPGLGPAMNMTGVVVHETEDRDGKEIEIELTRMNPAHRRLIQNYVQSANKPKRVA